MRLADAGTLCLFARIFVTQNNIKLLLKFTLILRLVSGSGCVTREIVVHILSLWQHFPRKHPIRNAILLFTIIFWGQKDLPFALRCDRFMVTSVLTHVWCKKFAHGLENIISQHYFFASGIKKLGNKLVQALGPAEDVPPSLLVCGQDVQCVDEFTYLGVLIHSSCSSEPYSPNEWVNGC